MIQTYSLGLTQSMSHVSRKNALIQKYVCPKPRFKIDDPAVSIK